MKRPISSSVWPRTLKPGPGSNRILTQSFTDKSVSEAKAALQASVQANHLGVMQVHNLKETMARKGVVHQRVIVGTEPPDHGGQPLKPAVLLS